MKKRRMNMYEMLIKDNKTNKHFFSDTQSKKEKDVKIEISHKIVQSLSKDMQDMADYMMRSILEGLVDGRK